MKEIVFIDDDMKRIQYYMEYLQLDGFDVKCFSDDISALDYIGENHSEIGCVILDMIMPSKKFKKEDTNKYYTTGKYVLMEIRKITSEVPVILFSIRRDMKSIPDFNELKFNEMLIKDETTPGQLSEKISEIIGRPPN